MTVQYDLPQQQAVAKAVRELVAALPQDLAPYASRVLATEGLAMALEAARGKARSAWPAHTAMVYEQDHDDGALRLVAVEDRLGSEPRVQIGFGQEWQGPMGLANEAVRSALEADDWDGHASTQGLGIEYEYASLYSSTYIVHFRGPGQD